jgi:hypothetical protein
VGYRGTERHDFGSINPLFGMPMKITLALLFLAILALVYWRHAAMPKVTKVNPGEMRFSQLDITEQFGDQNRLSKEEWIATVALNSKMPDPESRGLPPHSATVEETYAEAAKLSAMREHFVGSGDGVYCPVCHIANVDHGKLHAPCPKCGRKLLSFGWD